MTEPEIDDATTEALQAAAFRALVAHLRARSDVQNIDLMNLAGFCRNCLSRWYRPPPNSRRLWPKPIPAIDPARPRPYALAPNQEG